MADKTASKTPAPAPKAAAPSTKTSEAPKAGEKKPTANKRRPGPQILEQKTVEKPRWTLKRVQRIARRFETVALWSEGHPSSWKAAVAFGWDKKVELKGTKQARQLPRAG